MTMLEKVREERAAKQTELDALLASVEKEERSAFNETESATFTTLSADLDALVKTEAELVAVEARRATAAKTVDAGAAKASVTSEPNPVYRRDNGTSFFRDLAVAASPNRLDSGEARARIVAAQERRAGSSITPDGTTGATHGGEFAPPEWLVNEFVQIARPGRVTADLLNNQVLPGGISSINLPVLLAAGATSVQASGTTGTQTGQGSVLTSTSVSSTSVSTGILTIAGQSVLPQQLLDQSGIPFDRIVLEDLARVYAVNANTVALSNTNTSVGLGLLSVATAGEAVTGTGAALVASLYAAVNDAAAKIQASIFQSPDAIIMHPARWAFILGSVDSSSRPLVVPQSVAFNPVGAGQNMPQGYAGTFAGYPVYVDPGLPATTNTTVADQMLVLVRGEHWAWETAPSLESFNATFADDLSVLYRIHGYRGQIFNRRTAQSNTACVSISVPVADVLPE